MKREDFMCPCSDLVKGIGGCACDNMNLNSECKAFMFLPEKRKRKPTEPKTLEELKLKTNKKLRGDAVRRKATPKDFVNYLIRYKNESTFNSNP